MFSTVIATAAMSLIGLGAFDDINVKATLDKPKAGDNALVLRITDAKGAPVGDAKMTLSVGMTNMDMGTTHPKVTNKGDGNYSATVNFSMAGPWRVTARADVPNHRPVTKSFDFTAKAGGEEMPGMKMEDMSSMMGRLGPWSMQREGSGTSWLPDSSPMFMKMLPKAGRYDLNTMGFITFNENDAGGMRGDSKFFSNSMLMLMARRKTGGGVLGLSLMASVGSSRVDLQACKLEYSIVSPK